MEHDTHTRRLGITSDRNHNPNVPEVKETPGEKIQRLFCIIIIIIIIRVNVRNRLRNKFIIRHKMGGGRT